MKTTILISVVALLLLFVYIYYSYGCYEIIVELDIYNNTKYSKMRIRC